jgi:hypothetical protein
MRIAFLILMIALVVGCGKAPDLSNKETMAEILDQAIELEKIQYRGKRGEELRYAPNETAPYTGWAKEMYPDGQVAKLFHFEDGKMDGIQNEWEKNGQKSYEVNFKDNIEAGRVTIWWGNGQKMLEGQFKGGKLMSAESWTVEGTANGKQVVDGKGEISIGSGQAGNPFLFPINDGALSLDFQSPMKLLDKILRTGDPLEKRRYTYIPSMAAPAPPAIKTVTPRPRPVVTKPTPVKTPDRKTLTNPQPQVRPRPNRKPIKIDPNAVNNLPKDLLPKAKPFRPGTTSYNRYKELVASIYQQKWNRGLPPKKASYRGKVVRVRVTVGFQVVFRKDMEERGVVVFVQGNHRWYAGPAPFRVPNLAICL